MSYVNLVLDASESFTIKLCQKEWNGITIRMIGGPVTGQEPSKNFP